MIHEDATVSIEKGKYEVKYVKAIPENLADVFELSLDGETLSAELTQAINAVDKLCPAEKDADGKEIASPMSRLLGNFFYGRDLGVKAGVRREFEKTLEDPTKLVIKGIAGMVNLGFSFDQAYDLVSSQRAALGSETPSKADISAKMK